MNVQNHYPDKPFAPEQQTEWVRAVLALMAAWSEAAQEAAKIAS